MAIVYKHIRLDTNEIFYVGISVGKKRAYSSSKRNKLWHNIVNKCGFSVEISHDNLIWEEACVIEQYLISFYGRKDLGTGILVNMTEGGDGRYGSIISEETKKKMSESHKGLNTWTKERYLAGLWNPVQVYTPEYREKLSRAKKGKPNNFQGKKHSEETILKIKEANSGKNNVRYGIKHTEETLAKLKQAAKNRTKIECPHCHKLGDPGPMRYWHFNNCKKSKI